MKTITLVIIALFAYAHVSAQWSTSGSDIYNTNSGNVGIGTSSPTFKLSVLNSGGSISYNTGDEIARFTRTVDASTVSLHVYGFPNTSQLDSWPYLKKTVMLYATDAAENLQFFAPQNIRFTSGGWWDSYYEKMIITNSGTVGIGTSSPSSTYKLDIAGSVRATGGFITSDRRYKKNITDLSSSLDKIKKLNGVSYNYRAEEFKELRFNSDKQIGLLAQDVQKVFPELISTDDKGYLSVNYTALIPVIIEAVKEQNKLIDTKNQEIESLQKRLASIEEAVLALKNNSKEDGSKVGVLKQNFPNPTATDTAIEFDLPASTKQAIIVVHNDQGVQLKRQEITQRGKGSLKFNSKEFPTGIYTYSLVSDGALIDTKKMVIAR